MRRDLWILFTAYGLLGQNWFQSNPNGQASLISARHNHKPSGVSISLYSLRPASLAYLRWAPVTVGKRHAKIQGINRHVPLSSCVCRMQFFKRILVVASRYWFNQRRSWLTEACVREDSACNLARTPHCFNVESAAIVSQYLVRTSSG